ncbi:NAD-dependent epimerase/dehydratase family protein [candidate division CSSED10-310 bacterium]|uniref:NAD-dependent epimerase/dehydratase family protein n=1 Tax=candidate division CSSED10-310 bacterium TaxID=2855610 RepID=A0ABV6YZ21_UNCC1
MKIIVTGAAGFIGSHLCEHLSEQGHDVLGIDCFTDFYSVALKKQNAQDLKRKGIPILPLDLCGADLNGALKDVDNIYHLAAQPGLSATTTFSTYARNNITATYNLLEAARNQATLKCFIYISTSSVYGKYATSPEDAPAMPTSYYGVTKLAAEQLVLSYCRTGKIPACSLRLFSVYGPRERPEKLYSRLIKCILEDAEFPLYQGSELHTRSYTYIDDVMHGFLSVLKRLDQVSGEIFNIGSDIEITTGRGIEIVEEILGRQARKIIQPARLGDQLKTHANIEKARRILNYNPQTKPEDGLRLQIEWYKKTFLR